MLNLEFEMIHVCRQVRIASAFRISLLGEYQQAEGPHKIIPAHLGHHILFPAHKSLLRVAPLPLSSTPPSRDGWVRISVFVPQSYQLEAVWCSSDHRGLSISKEKKEMEPQFEMHCKQHKLNIYMKAGQVSL